MVTPSTRASVDGRKFIKVDDSDPSIQYTGSWTQGGTSNEFNKTAHLAGSSDSQATFTFYGTSVIVFGRLPNITASPNYPAATFAIDDGSPTVFNTVTPTQRNTIYQVPIFQSPSLNLGQHTLRVESHDNNQNLWIDFIMYTQPAGLTSTPALTSTSNPVLSAASTTQPVVVPTAAASAVETSTASTSDAGSIAGGVVGGVGGFVLLLALAIWLWRRKASSQKAAPSEFTPFMSSSDSNKLSGVSSQTTATTNDPLGIHFLSTEVSPSSQSGFSIPSVHDTQSFSAALAASQPIQTSMFRVSRKPRLNSLDSPTRVDPVQETDGDALPPPYHTGHQ
ncbi:hypothetical protein AX17_004197 [Amanita inopinata Kibby_2008]|nr:hypothetical protein AX17_004197 [Amanita inopinata Kibby_2008]